MQEIISDALIDTLKLLPFLFLTYLAMEWLESRSNDKINSVIAKANRHGPLIGGLAGLIPSCGLASAAANLYAGGVINLGTLLAVFLASSDEMLPLLISHKIALKTVLILLAIKGAIGISAGYLVNLFTRSSGSGSHIDDLCASKNCHCEQGSIFKSALIHTLNIAFFVLLINLVLNAVLTFTDQTKLAALFSQSFISIPLAGLIGLIPNCASSVALTQLWLDGIINAAALITGLTVNAGVGLLVLFRVCPSQRQAVKVAVLLYIIGIASGFILQLAHIVL